MTPYVMGPHALVGREREAMDLPVRGELPVGLAGTFVRNSADPAFGAGPRYHWFDGDGMVHALHVADGRVSYRNRWTRTRKWVAEHEAGRPLWEGLHDARGPLEDTANTDLIVFDGQLVATWWLTGQPMSLALPSLETRGPATAGGVPLPRMAAHPKVDPRTGDLVFMGYDVMRRPWVTVGAASPDGRVHTTPIEVPHPHVPHDIGLTEHHTILLDMPLGWTTKDSGKRRLGFFRDRPTRFGLLPRWGAGSEVRWFETDPCYVYHLSGTWEEDGEVVIVGCRIADPIPDRPSTDERTPRLDTIELVPHLYRWRIDPVAGTVRGEQLDDVPTEFPRVDDRRWGRPVRHAFHPRLGAGPALTFDGLVRYDLDAGTSTFRAWGDGRTSGEVVFAPRPGGTEDDDGWLLTVVNEGDRASTFVGWCARTLEPLFEVPLPFHVPQGFHAEWAPTS
ncbi:MAG: carotenoid oxygenase family protein [Alphaproteobacteria bacterium]|nr:carotenoid oxygenase family protein [Alphaproteobacteria bacterium]MCB9695436.1 carotenoid oxygenase family protein [Alphaproteobacteria bacterium]